MSWLPPDEDDEIDGPYAAYADHAVRQRPNPKANRPRTKRRPEHSDSVIGMVTFSGGVADVFGYESPRLALRAADESLYRAKEEGRNRICVAGRQTPAEPINPA